MFAVILTVFFSMTVANAAIAPLQTVTFWLQFPHGDFQYNEFAECDPVIHNSTKNMYMTKCTVKGDNAIVLVDFANSTSQFGWVSLYLKPIGTGSARSIYVYYPGIHYLRVSKTYGKYTVANDQLQVQGFPMVRLHSILMYELY